MKVRAEKHGVVRCVDDVHGTGNDPAAENAVALHGGDGGLGNIAPTHGLVYELLAGVVEAAAQACLQRALFTIRLLVRRAQVVAAGEVLAGTEQGDNVYLPVLGCTAEGFV